MRVLRQFVVVLLFCAPLLAQQTELVWSEDFEHSAQGGNPQSWLDPSGRFAVAKDGTNSVYGAKHPGVKQRSMLRKPLGAFPEDGAMTTLGGRAFLGENGFQYRGRFKRASEASLLGLTFFSKAPEVSSYHMVALWRGAMRLYQFGETPVELDASTFTPLPNVWYRFAIRVDRDGSTTRIRAHFWRDGDAEPDTWDLQATQTSVSAPVGRIGLWSSVGAAAFDDLSVSGEAQTEVDKTPPAIVFSEAGETIEHDATESFNRDARVLVRALDASGIASLTVTLDGAPYVPETVIATEQRHVLRARAVDKAGNAADAQIAIVIDKTPPVLHVLENGVAMPDGLFVNRDVVPSFTADDTTDVAISATLDGQTFVSAGTIAAEAAHHLVVTATDAVGWTSTVTRDFVIDRTPPVITFNASAGVHNADTPVGITANDANGIASLVATLDGAAFAPGAVIASEGAHVVHATAVDRAGNAAQGELRLTIDKTPPVIHVLENGVGMPDGLLVNRDVVPSFNVDDATEVTINATLDGQPFNSGTSITAEAAHHLVVTAKDAAGWTSSVARDFVIDRTPPVITFDASAGVRNADTPVGITANDANGIASLTTTLDGATFTPGAVIATEGTHVVQATAVDKAGNHAEGELRLTIDKTPPVIHLIEHGANMPDGLLVNRDVVPSFTADDATDVSITATLDGQPFASGASVTAEAAHHLVVTAKDAAGWTSSVTRDFVIDRTPPVITFSEGSGTVVRKADTGVGITATDANGIASLAATLDGASYASGALITSEGAHALHATATDKAGNVASADLGLVLDKTPPVIAVTNAGAPLANGLLTQANVTPEIAVTDATETHVDATLNGAAFTSGTVVSAERQHALAVTATDAAGWTSSVALDFTIDRTPPVVTITSPAANQRVGGGTVDVHGTSDDAVRVLVNGVEATLDLAAHTFTRADVPVAEGENPIAAEGTDAAGNTGHAALKVRVDTRAPELLVSAPLANACIGTADVTVRGTMREATAITVRANDGAPVNATIAGSDWTATVPLPNEGNAVLTITATDEASLTSTLTVPVRVDRTKPVIVATESAAPLTATLFNRPLAPLVRVTDADPSAQLAVTINGAPFTEGMVLRDDATYVLRATATDCAGNAADPLERTFTIDRTPPRIVAITPAKDASVGTKPPLTGTLSEPATLVDEESGTAALVVDSADGVTFTLAAPLVEGLNERVFVITDRAGNVARETYALRVQTSAPLVEIVESGTPIPPAALFNRIVKPLVRVNDANATITATLNGAPFTSGSDVTADASYTLTATATDAFGHTSAPATATFTIDRTPPRIDITTPLDNAAVTGERIDVTGTVDADAVSVSVNGVTATLRGTTFNASVLAEAGANLLTATAVDRAGNAGHDRVQVRRAGGPLAIILTSPPDNMLTNRPTTVVAGQVLTMPPSGTVLVNGVAIPVAAGGTFRKLDFPLAEGENAITASVANERGETSSVAVDVSADFTPPTLHLTANALDLGDGARFAAAPQLAVDASDNIAQGLVIEVTLDGAQVTGAIPQAGDGGHAITAVARDAAGNETRIDRTFFVGDSVTVSGCGLSNIDPADGTAVFGDTVRITGRSGGALSVLINGNAAMVADGSFCGEAALVPGRNEVVIRCADASGNPTSEPPVTLIINRDAEPTIAIALPAAGATLTTPAITVSGTVSAGVVSGDVNGLPITIANGAFTVANVALSPGLNTIVARAKSGSGRTAVATTRATLLNATPLIAITSPIDGTETGGTSVDVTGTYVNVDPSTIAVNGTPATATPQTDTSGTFRASATLTAGATTTVTAGGRNHAGTESRSSVDVHQLASAPSIVITSPADNSYSAATTIAVTGTFDAPAGSLVSVNGTQAALSGATFTATVPLGTGNATPLIARVTTPAGDDALDSVRVLRLASALALRESFPANDATGVDRGVAVILVFNNALDGASVANAIHVTDASNANVAGQLFVDRDAVTFAPNEALKAGETYAITIGTSLHDASGAALAAQQLLHFTTAGTAPAAPPLIDDLPTTGCLSTITMTGRATPGARVRLDADGIALTTTASDSGAFKFTFSFSGRSGFHIARVREIGSDGSSSAERAICFRNNCELPRVIGATLDRAAKKLTIDFSRAMDPSTLVVGSTIVFQPALTGSVAFSGQTATITFASALPEQTIALTVKKDVKDTSGAMMAADYTQSFAFDTTSTERGKGYVTGAVYDATTGRPLAGATITIDNTTIATNDRGRYSRALAEGAFTIEAAAEGFTTSWRQIVVPAGAGVVPIDIRLTRRGALDVLTSGGDTSVTKRVELVLPAGTHARLTSVGAQSLAGLLPLGWSPLASAEVLADTPLSGAKLTFITGATTRALTFVQYDSARDEWRVLASTVNVSTDRAMLDITDGGAYALVYPDDAPHLAHPPSPRDGDALQGAENRCLADASKCTLTSRAFTLDPHSILPNGRAVATLVTEGATQVYPSGTAVQATIDEQLNLSDGRVLVDPPFATDLLLYRTLAGDAAQADFHLAPTPQAAAVTLRDGVEHVRFVEYPGRIDRGTLIGAEGGRVPGDGSVTIDIPSGATNEPLHAAASSIDATDLGAFGSIAGFRIAAGFTLSLTRATTPPPPDEGTTDANVALLIPARASFHVDGAAGKRVIVAEVLPQTSYGVLFRLVAIADSDNRALFTTRAIDSTQLPLDGIVRDGRYLVLVADAPIAYAFGIVRGAGNAAIFDARVTSGLGVHGLTTRAGLFVLPVPSKPAAAFSLIARTPATGDGVPKSASVAPDANAYVDFGDLPLVAQPPVLRSVTPDGGEIPVTAAFVVRAEFDSAIDPASVTNGIRVTNLTTNVDLAGSVAAAGNSVTFNASEPLRAASSYAITIAPSIRGSNGAPFAQTVVKNFRTPAVPAGSTTIHAERIRITLPDANGKSVIRGEAGALPAGAQAVAVRRDRDFVVRYQATVGADGSFSVDAGNGHANDRISTTDLIDLQVIDAVSRGIIAVIPLTPFASDDLRSFIAPVGRDTTFVSADGIRVTVPAGAFDVPTLIHVAPAAQTAFNAAPNFANELRFASAIELQFEGEAQKKIELDVAVPSGADTSRNWVVGWLGESIRGPRVMIVDLAYASDGRFRTGVAPSGSGARHVVTNAAITGPELRNYLMGVQRSGIFAVLSFENTAGPVGFGIIGGVTAGVDLFFSTLESLFESHFYLTEGRGKIAVPVVMGKQFQIVGVDASTGLESFTKVYDPIAIGDPGTTVTLPPLTLDRQGPYPILGTPFRVELLDLSAKDIAITSVRDFSVTLTAGTVKATTTLPDDVNVTMLNASNGQVRRRSQGLNLPGAVGDRIVLLIAEQNVDPDSTFSIVFNEPIAVGDDPLPFFRITLDGQPIALKARLDANRRVVFDTEASLQRGGKYRLEISNQLADASGLRIGQVLDEDGNATPPLSEPLYLDFQVREPAGKVASFDLSAGVIRDQALNGNVLLVSAMDGGILAYDVSNPAALTPATMPIGRHPAGATSYWGLASDHHGRIYATGMTSLMGLVRSFRLEDFTAGNMNVAQRGASTVSFVPGAAASLDIPSRVIASDRPEAIPRKLQVLVQDDEVGFDSRAAFKDAGAIVTNTIGDLEELRFTSAFNPSFPYATQRVTVENLTLDMRWSADAAFGQPAQITGIVARANDRLRILYNRMTYGVVSLLGYGIAVIDLNAMESNDAATKPPGYVEMRELVRLTSGKVQAECGTLPANAIPDLEFIPDAAVRTVPGSSDIQVFGLDPHRGVLDLLVRPPASEELAELPPDRAICPSEYAERMSGTGLVFQQTDGTYEHPRLKKLGDLFQARTGRRPFGRFNAAAPYTWILEAQDNAVVTPATQPGALALGARGSIANERVQRDYVLIPANEYGLLVVEIGGDAPATSLPGAPPLTSDHLVDVIWIPHGAFAVRTIPRTKLATVTDGEGHVLLVDLSRIDERWNASGAIAANELFPTVKSILETDVDTPDPRIVWRSAEPLAAGTLAPVVDADTGFVFAGKLLEKTTNVVAALDPRIQIKADLGAANGLSEIGGVVPLGIEPPSSIALNGPNASLGAFRFEVALPGALNESMSGGLFRLDVDSERVFGAKTANTPAGWPRAHLSLPMQRTVPASLTNLRYQKGFNKWISPWVVAIADPRASESYAWPAGADRAAAGCYACERPQALKGKTEGDGVFELYSNGRMLKAHPNVDFSATPYAYLTNGDRLTARFATIMADTVRAPQVLVAAQSPAVAGGMLEETTYLHSGELETASVDLDAGGRAGWNVLLDRTYRSRTIGGTAMGEGWDSSIFRRLRALPTGDVEYRDGAGEVWRFRTNGSGGYDAPKGLFLGLTRNDRGWILADQKGRMTGFDLLGRLSFETDEFTTNPYAVDQGNIVRYLYGPDGLVHTILDPVGRETQLTYDGDRLLKAVDKRNRSVVYDHDAAGRLTKVTLPSVANTDGATPAITYGYDSAGGAFNDAIELSTNVNTISDLKGAPRLSFVYGSGNDRDKLTRQNWATGEFATFDHANHEVRDVLGQMRRYQLSAAPNDYHSDRPHVTQLDEQNVETSTFAFGALPNALTTIPPRAPQTRTFTFTYDGEGLLLTSALAGVSTTTNAYAKATSAPGFVLKQSTTASITRAFDFTRGFLKGATASDGTNTSALQFPVVHAAAKTASTTNDVKETVNVDAFGRTTSDTSSGGTDTNGAGAAATFTYDDNAPWFAKGALTKVDRAGVVTTLAYPSANRIEASEVERNVKTTTELDEWLRPKTIDTSGPGLELKNELAYDANGRTQTSKRWQDGRWITESFAYDAMGRMTSSKSNGIAVGDDTDSIVETKVEYDLANRKVTRTLPGGAQIIEQLDSLGRVSTRTTVTGSSDIVEQFAYDLAGNLVYASDGKTASATAYDAHGRAIESLAPDGTRSESQYDPLGNPTLVQARDANGDVMSETRPAFTSAGRLKAIDTKVDATQTRQTSLQWDGGGRTTLTNVAGRTSSSKFDEAGRLQSWSTPLTSYTADAHVGMLVKSGRLQETGASPVTIAQEYDTAANVTRQTVGTLAWQQKFDEDGNVTSALAPGRPDDATHRYDYDARGNLTAETKPGDAVFHHKYDGAGAPAEYRDPSDPPTTTTTDRIGRPLVRTYPDNTTESFTWDGPRIKSMTDRQGRIFSYEYNEKGQVTEVRNATVLLEEFAYDAAGRVSQRRTRDAELAYEDFDLEGRPRRTRQKRYAEHSGFGAKTVLDEFVQEHQWNVHGERTSWTMPLPAGFNASGWTARIDETHDAEGNLATMSRTFTGAASATPLMSATYRAAGRPVTRTINTGSASIDRAYHYDASTGQLDDLTVRANGVVVAGSHVEYQGEQVSKATLHGVSGGTRANEYVYDLRGRLASSRFGREEDDAAASIEHLTPADFRTQLERPANDPSKLPSLDFEEQVGHKIAKLTRGGETRTFSYGGGAERVSDGRFAYEFDARGRLTKVTELAATNPRRFLYDYSASGRLVGRRAEYQSSGDWKLEDRTAVLDVDGIPAETTFVWDPISDQLISVYTAGGATLLWQIIHGGAAYDDPIEVRTPEGALYPIYDEAAAGTLQATLNDQGEIVQRTLLEGAYGEDEFELTAPTVDRIAITATKAADGTLSEVVVSVRATDALNPATVATGARLAIVDANGTVIRSSPATPTLIDNDDATLRWTLTSTEWSTLTSSPGSLSITVTPTLRAAAWPDTTPFLATPDPRTPLASLTEWLATVPPATTRTTTLWHAPALAALGQRGTRVEFGSAFQGLPFGEGGTGLVYVRNRWYSPNTGTFLSPDPLGYVDSANLYAFAGGDPVNQRDPSGTSAATLRDGGVYVRNDKTGARYKVSGSEARANTLVLQDLLMTEGGYSAQDAKNFLQDVGLKYTHPYQRPVLQRALPHGDNWWMNSLIATSGLPPQNRQQEIVQGGLQIAGTAVMVFGGTYGSAGTVSVAPVQILSTPGGVSAPIPFALAVEEGWAPRPVKEGRWAPAEEGGRAVYWADDVFEPSTRSSWQDPATGRWKQGTNVERMADGLAPIGTDGKSVNLHHILQDEPGPLAEVPSSLHKDLPHKLRGRGESFRNDPALKRQFENFRREYWKQRSKDFR